MATPRAEVEVRTRRAERVAQVASAVVVAASLTTGCGLHDANNELGGAINLGVAGEQLVVARGDRGLDVVDARSGAVLSTTMPPGGDTIDDVTVDGDRVLALDADDGVLSVFRLVTGGGLTLLQTDVEVEVGPYSGLSASGGRAVVSGGTSDLQVLGSASDGSLRVEATLGGYRGQPEVTLVPGGQWAIASMHFSGSEDEFVDGQEYGIASVALDRPRYGDFLGLEGAGVTDGGGTPASWPVRVAIRGRTAFVAHGGGLDVIEVGGDGELDRRARISLPFPAVDVDAAGDRAWVVGGEESRIAEVDVSREDEPILLGTRAAPGNAERVSAIRVVAGRLALAVPARGVVLLDP